MSMGVPEYRTQRGVVKCQLTKMRTWVEAKASSGSIFELQTKMEMLENYMKHFDSIQSKIEICEPESELKSGERDTFEDIYCELKSKLLSYLSKQHPSTMQSTLNQSFSQGVSHHQSHNLPKLAVPTFNGQITSWLEFWMSFKSLVHDNREILPSDKLQYLKQALKGGKAETVLQVLDPCEENYDNAIKLIKSRYYKKRYLFQSHINGLFDMKPVCRGNIDQLHYMVDKINAHMTSMKSIATTEQIVDGLLIYIFTNKLDSQTQLGWEDHVTRTICNQSEEKGIGEETPLKYPNWKEFCLFIESTCETHEILSCNKQVGPYTKSNGTSFSHTKRSTSLISGETVCQLCNEKHLLFQCESFAKLSQAERFREVKRLGLCINCIRGKHSPSSCKSRNCKHCAQRHHSMLHIFGSPKASGPSTSSSQLQPDAVSFQPTQSLSQATGYTPQVTNQSSTNALLSSYEFLYRPPLSSHPSTTLSSNIPQMPEEVLLSTAIVDAFCINGETVPCRILLDSGSQSNFVTESFANLVKCQKKRFNKCIGGIGNVTTRCNAQATIKIKSRYCNTSLTLDALVLKSITGLQPHHRFDLSEFKFPSNIALADPHFNYPQKVDILLGNQFIFSLLCVGQIKTGPLILQKSVFGWIASGSYLTPVNNLWSLHSIAEKEDCTLPPDTISKILGNFYMAEEIPATKTKFTAEDQACEDHFLATHKRNSAGRYIVQLPFKSFTLLGESYQIAIKRFFSLERKLHRDEKLRKSYIDFIEEYTSMGHMTPITTEEWINQPHYFLPHHPVIKEDSSSTKLRVVFDGSSKTLNGKSLNDILMVGPTIQPDLFTLLIKFRLHRFVLAADITKMYRQIELNSCDQLYQLILWRATPEEEVKVLKLNTVTYGTSSAAFLAIRSMTHLAEQEKESFPLGSDVVLNDFYVDNLLTGSDSIEKLKIIKREVTELLKKGCFPLRKWMSNHKELLADIESHDMEKFMIIGDQNIVKALGLIWNPNDDLFVFNQKLETTTKSYTKRYILSRVGSFFDPLGLLAPLVLAAKLFLRHLWLLKLEWDESLPQHLQTEWALYEEQFNSPTSISIPRPAISSDFEHLEIHGFCDASSKAYGACVYIRSIDSHLNSTTTLLCAKSKVSSVKPTVTLPRLELCSAVLLTELLSKIVNLFTKDLSSIYCWTDSTIALSWINTSPVLMHTFVSNRIQKIQSLSSNFIWRHVPGELNPADIASRGSLVQDLVNSNLWFEGPSFLSEDSSKWPSHPALISSNQLPEYKELNFSFISEDTIDLIATSKFANNHTNIVSVFTYVLRFMNKSRTKGPLTNEELYKTELVIARYLQRLYYPQEYKALSSNKSIPGSSNLASLAPFIDDSGVIRVGGRLKHAAMPFDSKHQILLPTSHPYTKALLIFLHKESFHCGAQSLLYILRQRYWITSGQRACNSVTHRCIICARLRPVFKQQLMANLPKDRITPCHPFSVCGVDYCGPFTIKYGSRNRSRAKMYVCLFVCFVTKAVHIEIVTNLTTEAFISTLQQFIARRGKPYKIYSDNATNFVGANNFLKELHLHFSTQEHNDKVQRFCQPDIEWCFIPPRSPHFGGLWESGVKIAKRHMTRKLLNYVPTENELRTIMYQVEAIMNSRPISPMSNDANDLIPLTPGHFLIGRPLAALNSPSVLELNPNRLNSFQQLQHIIQSFWNSFYKDVLNNQQTRNKNKFPERNLKTNDIVILVDDNLPPLK